MCEQADGLLLRCALDALEEGFAVFRAQRDPAGDVCGLTLEAVNEAGRDWFGTPEPDVPAGSLPRLDRRLENAEIAEWLVAALGQHTTVRKQIKLDPDGDGSAREVVASPLGDDRIVVTCRDVTETACAERLLASAYEDTAAVRATLQTALDATTDAFAVYELVLDEDLRVQGTRLVLINAAGAAPLGVEPDDLVGQDLREFLPSSESNGLWTALQTTVDVQVTQTFRVHEIDGSGRWISSWDNTIAPVGMERVVLTWRDVTEDERRERELATARDQARHAATHDPLTGLANRALLLDRLTEALWSSGHQERVGVVFIDLDGFKQVNDTLGHAVGDDLLLAVAARLTRLVRSGDTAARIGGDEFVLLLRNLPEDWDEKAFVGRAEMAVQHPVLLGSTVTRPVASYGVAVSPPDERNLDLLLHLADARMYEHKQSHRAGRPARR